MTPLAGRTIGFVGALAAFPRRLALREVARQGGRLRHGTQAGPAIVVFGRKGLQRLGRARIAEEVDAVRRAQRQPMSENGFLRKLGLLPPAPQGSHARDAMLAQSGLPAGDLDMLALFDAFECDSEPFSFRDLVLARKYAVLMANGAEWPAIAQAIHGVADVGALTALTLDVEARDIIARRPGRREDLAGQGLLDLGDDLPAADNLFIEAEDAEAGGDVARAATLYSRCIAIDPSDSVAAFNRANCLAALGRHADAAHDYARAVRQDPRFVEAWFNLAGLMAARGRAAAARRHLTRALEIDPGYADASFNLAKLAFEDGDPDTARHWWQHYLNLDSTSEWAQRARNGLRLIALQSAAAGSA